MNKFISIKQKFISRVMAMIAAIFIFILAVILSISIKTSSENLKSTESSIKNALFDRGRILADNNSKALLGMALDNSFTAIKELVESTVAGDKDIVRGIYMTNERIPFVYATSKDNQNDKEISIEPLSDSVDLRVVAEGERKLKSNNRIIITEFYDSTLVSGGHKIIEFAAPVIDPDADDDSKILGFIRYSISTESLYKEINDAQLRAKKNRNTLIIIILLLLSLAQFFGWAIINKLATTITSPIEDLVKSAKLIADGDYSIEITTTTNDEIGNLAYDFEVMRKTVKQHTENLQELVDEKMNEVKDILNNIDQGLFTVNFDGTINDGYSAKANDILKVGDVSAHKVYDLLRLDDKEKVAFDTWVNLIKSKHQKHRWKKLERLAPIHTLELNNISEDEEQAYIAITYQKVFDKNGNFTKLMVLTLDETEKREKERLLKEEREAHENEMAIILGIVNTPEEELLSFIKDSENRIETVNSIASTYLKKVQEQRKAHPDKTAIYNITTDDLDTIFRDIHTLKGNAGSYGFNFITKTSTIIENKLELLREPLSTRRSDILESIILGVQHLKLSVDMITEKKRILFSDDDAVSIKVPEERIDTIQILSKQLKKDHNDFNILELLNKNIIELSWKPLKTVARKYQKTAEKAARIEKKEINFKFLNGNEIIPSDSFIDVDDILIHIVRNSVAHGIETSNNREELGKPPIGSIYFDFTNDNNIFKVSIEDDGAGIDKDIIFETALRKGLVTEADKNRLSDKDKINLIFLPNFSTAESVNEVAGRGVGMDVVKEKLAKIGGEISVDTTIGKGSKFTIIINGNGNNERI